MIRLWVSAVPTSCSVARHDLSAGAFVLGEHLGDAAVRLGQQLRQIAVGEQSALGVSLAAQPYGVFSAKRGIVSRFR